ncbi:acetyltransferase [Duganella sp. Leaf126]|uniref:GNAT family N-acetyltransferase n=1 Tax=Duganella sp. Leaf126 TaxID=1736266 RepID=UPI0006F9C7A1|nr:GNAT family N-acetyltransferase [Duganella sp. Leaf126]KQQ32472.1 acetyltransferase [Duganella sp. Leaf126]
MHTPTVRTALPADIAAMEALIRRSGLGLSDGFYTPAQARAITEHVFGVDTQLVADRTYFVVEVAGTLVACGGWSRRATLFGADRMKQAADPLLDPATEPARIRAFFVEPSAARRGYGRLLLEWCTDAAAAGGFTVLELAATLPGVPLYAACGFERMEDIAINLPGPAPAAPPVQVGLVRMRKQLSATRL